jgi:hypothetical protein
MATRVEVEPYVTRLNTFYGLAQLACMELGVIDITASGADIERDRGRVALLSLWARRDA